LAISKNPGLTSKVFMTENNFKSAADIDDQAPDKSTHHNYSEHPNHLWAISSTMLYYSPYFHNMIIESKIGAGRERLTKYIKRSSEAGRE
jgi:hypothetical protein